MAIETGASLTSLPEALTLTVAAELEWYHIFPGTAYLPVWAYGLKNASINLVGKLLTTNSVRLITIIGGYLLLRPYLQQFLSTDVFPSGDESLQKVPHDAKPPNVSPNNLMRGTRTVKASMMLARSGENGYLGGSEDRIDDEC